MEMRGTTTSLVGDQTQMTPPKMIVGVAVNFKRKMVSTPIEFGVVASIAETSLVAHPYP